MCGMVGFVGKQSAAPILLRGLQQFEYRGYDSAGVAVMDGDRIRVEKVSGRIARLCEKTDNGASVPGRTGIGHSARDSFEMLERLGVPMEPKAFSMGVRIEHRQADIDRTQYGRARGGLPAADGMRCAEAVLRSVPVDAGAAL